MARSRNLKPGFFQNEDLSACGPYAMILFEGLWCHADREGRLEDRRARIKSQVIPYFNEDCDALLAVLHDAGFIVRYEADGKKYIQVLMFDKHQNPHPHEVKSIIPSYLSRQKHYKSRNGRDKSHTNNAVSLLPITLTDSLNPITTLSGKPDVVLQEKQNNNQTLTAKAIEVLEFLNTKTGRKYRGLDGNGHPTVNLKLIIDRMKTGIDVQDFKTMIARKHRDWSADDKMKQYLRPSTLFRASNFEQYLGECVAK